MPNTSLKLNKEFGKLNKEQKDAVDTINGPVMVIAGPGTGKTQILTLRIANILLKTDASPENILTLTFTESAATNIRKRLVEFIGTQGYYANIFTFHGFCNQIINDYPEKFPHIIGSSPATQIDQVNIIRKIIDNSNFKKIKPIGNTYYYLNPILKSIRDLKNEGINHVDLKKLSSYQKKNILRLKLTKKQISDNLKSAEKNYELAQIYYEYQNELHKKKLYDFEDMVLETIKALEKDKDLLLDMQEKYQYILIDEHQDTNGAQNKALELISVYDNNPNLFIVGDEKQAIFRFQGASLENFLYFKNKFPKVKLINLKENYRSTQKILDASHSIIEKNTATLALELRSQLKNRGEKIKVCKLLNQDSECEFIADKIKYLINKKTATNEIAVLFRENKDSKLISEILGQKGIRFAVESDENILEDFEIKKLNILFESIENFAKPEYMAKAMHLDFFGIEPIDIYKSLDARATIAPSVEKIYKKIGEWKKLSYNVNFANFFETVSKESGFIAGLLKKPNYPEKISKLNSLFKEVKKRVYKNHNYSLSDYIQDIKILSEHNIPIRTKTPPASDSVRLMTAHKAKGLEFDYVFIIGARDKHWGNKRDISLFKLPIASLSRLDSAEKNEDERRLFYMAITRARKEVFITYPEISDDGRQYVPSQFINEIRPDLKEEIDNIKQSEHISLFINSAKPNIDTPINRSTTGEKIFIRDLFLSRGLSPTSLNNYLRCPWQFFYSNLLRLPQTPKLAQIYGTAKHKAFQSFFDLINKNKKIGSNYLVSEFEKSLKKQPIKENDFKYLLKKGTSSIKDYYNFYKGSFNNTTFNEYKIKGVDFAFGKEKIKLTGKLDKIEINPKNRSAIVTDYKTRKPATRNWILGNTKDSTGDYFRQLVFYKLLLDSIPSASLGKRPYKKFNMETGVIDFTEPLDFLDFTRDKSARGKPEFKKEAFEISNSDVKNLSNLIEKTADEILNLKFWDKGCGKKDCEFCSLRALLPGLDRSL